MWSSWYLCGTPSNRILIDSSASTIQTYLVLCFPILRQVSPRQFVGVLQGIAAGIGISSFLRAFFMVRLSFSPSGSVKKIPRFCQALSSIGFSKAHFCFTLRLDASDICFHISGHNLSGLEVVCFLVSLLTDHVYPSGGRSFNTVILWNLSMHLIILFLHQLSSNHQYFSNNTSKWRVCVCFW